MSFLTPEIFDAVVVGIIIVGLVAAFFRLRADLTRPMPDDWRFDPDEDTKPNEKQS
jgi:hypothetical protein